MPRSALTLPTAFPTLSPCLELRRWRDVASFLYHGREEEAGGTPGEVPAQSCVVSGISRGLRVMGENYEGWARTWCSITHGAKD